MKGWATLVLLLLVGAADMLWSPGLGDSATRHQPSSADVRVPAGVSEALSLYLESSQPARWEQRRLAAAFLLRELDPPRQHLAEWERLGARLENSAAPMSAWECWQAEAGTGPPAHGLFAGYQKRLSGLRRTQLQAVARGLRPSLEKNDYAAYLEKLPRLGESSGPLWLALTLQPLTRVGRDDFLPPSWWWPILLNESNHLALRAGIRLARGQSPEIAHRWEGHTCVCWTSGPDGQDDGGLVEASFQPPGEALGDWVYRFR